MEGRSRGWWRGAHRAAPREPFRETARPVGLQGAGRASSRRLALGAVTSVGESAGAEGLPTGPPDDRLEPPLRPCRPRRESEPCLGRAEERPSGGYGIVGIGYCGTQRSYKGSERW
jgi:hypothetical protein